MPYWGRAVFFSDIKLGNFILGLGISRWGMGDTS